MEMSLSTGNSGGDSQTGRATGALRTAVKRRKSAQRIVENVGRIVDVAFVKERDRVSCGSRSEFSEGRRSLGGGSR